MPEFEVSVDGCDGEITVTAPVLSVLAGFTGLLNPPKDSTINSLLKLAARSQVERNLRMLNWSND